MLNATGAGALVGIGLWQALGTATAWPILIGAAGGFIVGAFILPAGSAPPRVPAPGEPLVVRRLVERRQRGVLGWVFLALFWGWNLFMGWALVVGMGNTTAEMAALTTDAERSAYATGVGIGAFGILIVWAVGSVVFGLLAYFTRGKRELIEYTSHG